MDEASAASDQQTYFERMLLRSIEVVGIADAGFDEASEPTSPRGIAAMLLCRIASQHALSIRFLIEAEQPTSAIVLLRAQLEALVRATWVTYVATDEEVATLTAPLNEASHKAARKMPSIDKMVKQLQTRGPQGPARQLVRAHERLTPFLNSYVHSGLHAVARHQHGFPTHLLIDTLKISNSMVILTLLVVGEIAQDEVYVSVALGLHEKYEDCMPTLEPFDGPA